MTCEEMMDLMQRNLDQDLTAAEERALYAHLEKCPDCSDLYERLKLLSDELAQLPKVKPAYSIVDAILPQLESLPGWNEADPDADKGMAAAVAAEEESPAFMPAAILDGGAGKASRKKGFVSWKVFSGVAAAGIALGMFIFNGGGSQGNESAAESQVMADRLAAAAQPAGKESAGGIKADGELQFSAQITAEPQSPVPAAGAGADKDQASALEKKSADTLTGQAKAKEVLPRDSREVSAASSQDMGGLEAKDQYGATVEPMGTSANGTDGVKGKAQDASADSFMKNASSNPAASPEAPGSEGKTSGTEASDDPNAMQSQANPGSSEPDSGVGKSAERNFLQGIMPMTATMQPVASADGLYTAELKGHSVTITGKDGSVVFTSGITMAAGDQIAFGGWSEQHVFSYTITKSDGKETVYRIYAADKKELSE